MNKSNIPNSISIARVIISVAIPFSANNHILLFALILSCGITDILDGYLARRLKCESVTGSRLDSLGDYVFIFSVITWLLLYETELLKNYYLLIIAIIIIRIGSLLMCLIKNKKVYSIHTLMNKAAGLLIFIGICTYILLGESSIIGVILWLSLISAVEEFVIMGYKKSPDPDTKSIFHELSNKSGQ